MHACCPKSLLSHEYVCERWNKISLDHIQRAVVIGCGGQTIAKIIGKQILNQAIQEFSAWVSSNVDKLSKLSVGNHLNRFLSFYLLKQEIWLRLSIKDF